MTYEPDGRDADYVYELRWKNPQYRKGEKFYGECTNATPKVQVVLTREVESSGEQLTLKSVTLDGKDLSSEVELRIRTMPEGEHWLDSGIFHITLKKK